MRPPRPSRGLPTSRAYWELKAEQMMNRVFAPEAAIDLEPLPTSAEASPTATSPHRPLPPLPPSPVNGAHAPSSPPPAGVKPGRRASSLTLLLASVLGGVGLVAALGAVLLVQQWAGLQRNLSQERHLLLVERLRALGPATAAPASEALATPPAPVLDPVPTVGAPANSRGVAAFDGLPPPPPEEPWMAQLADLPPSGGRPLLRVPVSARLAAAAPAVAAPPGGPAVGRAVPPTTAAGGQARQRGSGPLPQLVGLVGAPGRAGSAIFQVGNTAMTVNAGEQIGGSGWLLRSADAESALIERGTDVRRIAIVSGG
ncbi:MAG: hypothetical protein ACK6BC_02960 [Cyanobacteriota bacterium]